MSVLRAVSAVVVCCCWLLLAPDAGLCRLATPGRARTRRLPLPARLPTPAPASSHCSPHTQLPTGLTAEYEHAAEWVRTSMPLTAKFDASVFESIIRVVGGCLAAHDLTGDVTMLAKCAPRSHRPACLLLLRVPAAAIPVCLPPCLAMCLLLLCLAAVHQLRALPPHTSPHTSPHLSSPEQGARGGRPPAAGVRHAHRHPLQHHRPSDAGAQEPHLEPAVRRGATCPLASGEPA